MQNIRILIADDHSIVAESLSILIDTMEDFEVVGTAKNGWEILSFLEINEVDVVLSDLYMPLMNGIETTIRMREKFPKVKMILLTMSEDAGVIKQALAAKVDGYVMKNIEKKELEVAIKKVVGGQRYFSEAVVMTLAEAPVISSLNAPETTPALTARESEILLLILQELTNNDIASRIFISPTTVETHRRNLMKKLGINSVLGLMKYALKHDLIK